jgi:predicted XRE-type DNA-binding protein
MNLIKEDILKRKMTQAEYAELIGLSYPQVYRLAVGLCPISKQTRMLMQLNTEVLQSIQIKGR